MSRYKRAPRVRHDDKQNKTLVHKRRKILTILPMMLTILIVYYLRGFRGETKA